MENEYINKNDKNDKNNYNEIDNRKNLFNYINRLPDEMKNIIFDYIPLTSLIFTNKTNYINYHYLLKLKLVPKTLKENYIRDIIRRDLEFVFERILHENFKKWLLIKHFIYKNIIYGNYIYFLRDFCLMNESNKCRLILNKFLEEIGLCKNQHKKNTSKHIRWKN